MRASVWYNGVGDGTGTSDAAGDIGDRKSGGWTRKEEDPNSCNPGRSSGYDGEVNDKTPGFLWTTASSCRYVATLSCIAKIRLDMKAVFDRG